ncbi:MAG: YlbF family regulator [Ruminococcus sp.]|nr:YlbF family regulator [Ruminococcus sp.]MDE6678075.1 YlbF family regulator [Ruminococcus sp.]
MDVIQMTRELGKAIQQDERYIAYSLAKQVNDEDKDLQEDIAKFESLRIDMREAMSGENPDFDKINAIDKETKTLYNKIMSNPNMIAFSKAQTALEELVTNISQIISLCANGENPETCEAPKGCSGNCSACGGCG